VTDEARTQGEPARHGLRARVFAIRSVANFQGLDDEGLTLLAEHARELAFPRGAVISREGDPARAIYLVLDGRVKVSRKGQTVAVQENGRGIGLFTALAGAPSPQAVAELDTRVLEIPIAVFLAALEENFSLLRTSLRLVCAAILRLRGNLPVHPSAPQKPVETGEYYERPATFVERIIDIQGQAQTAVDLEALIELARRTQEIRVPEGHLFWSVGDPATFSLRMTYGRVRCTSQDGQQVTVGKSFNIGVLDSWSAQPRTYEARAETRVIAYRNELEDFATMLENHVGVGLEFVTSMARALASGQGVN
jgi:CRP-like cAMP-binding protein